MGRCSSQHGRGCKVPPSLRFRFNRCDGEPECFIDDRYWGSFDRTLGTLREWLLGAGARLRLVVIRAADHPAGLGVD